MKNKGKAPMTDRVRQIMVRFYESEIADMLTVLQVRDGESLSNAVRRHLGFPARGPGGWRGGKAKGKTKGGKDNE